MLQCKRCGYRWKARITAPKSCPDCKSRGWRTPKVIK